MCFCDRLQVTKCQKIPFKIGSLLRCLLCRHNTGSTLEFHAWILCHFMLLKPSESLENYCSRPLQNKKLKHCLATRDFCTAVCTADQLYLTVKHNKVARQAKRGFGTDPSHLYKALNEIIWFTVVNNNTEHFHCKLYNENLWQHSDCREKTFWLIDIWELLKVISVCA